MKNKTYILNTLLTAVLGIALLIAVLVRTFAPNIIVPALDIPNMAALSRIGRVLDLYLAPGAMRCYFCIPVLGALAFGLLPFAACFVDSLEALKLGVVGGVVFTAATWLFSSAQERLSSGPAAKAAPILAAVGLYLAAQCLMGIIL